MTGLSAWLGQRSWLEALGYCVRLVYGSLLGSSGVFNVLNPLPSGERGLPEVMGSVDQATQWGRRDVVLPGGTSLRVSGHLPGRTRSGRRPGCRRASQPLVPSPPPEDVGDQQDDSKADDGEGPEGLAEQAIRSDNK